MKNDAVTPPFFVKRQGFSDCRCNGFKKISEEDLRNFNSIKKNSDFQKTYRMGKSYANKLLIMYVRESGQEKNRIGISVSKKVGNSVVRHHITRLIREVFRLNEEIL